MVAAVSIVDVVKNFGSLQALAGVSMDIEQGEFFGLLGPNGAGKTTLISILAGITQPDSGSVQGEDVAWVPQQAALYRYQKARQKAERQAALALNLTDFKRAIYRRYTHAPHLAARFEREARVTARLQHPGIVPIYEIGKWPDGTPFYTMRMVDGRTLRDALAAAPTLGARLALLPALISAASAGAFAHAQRVIHRDLTPANVIVSAYGETVVID